MGSVSVAGRRSFRMAPVRDGAASVEIVAGDGLCFVDATGKLQGFRVNKVADGEIFPAEMPALRPGMPVFRNFDHAFDKLLARESAVRRLQVAVRLSEVPSGYVLSMEAENGVRVERTFAADREPARASQHDNIVRQLSKWGDTPFEAASVAVDTQGERFIPSSRLSEWRRACAADLVTALTEGHRREVRRAARPLPEAMPSQVDYTANVYNAEAARVYRDWGVAEVAPAFEAQQPDGALLMSCRHCLRYAFGACPHRQKGRLPWKEPVSLRLPDGREFPVRFDCKHCQMNVYAPRVD